MNTKLTVLAVACALSLAACSDNAPPPASPDTTPATTSAPAPAQAPNQTPNEMPNQAPPTATDSTPPMTPAPAAAQNMGNKPTAEVKDCATEFEGTDAMQYSISSIVVPSSCKNFKITLKHTGKMPVSAMGHDVVITKKSDMEAVDKDGQAAGLDNGYLKPNDSRVIAHTKLIGGGETTSVSFPVSKIQGDGPYEFFCSFPGHSALMKGSISVK